MSNQGQGQVMANSKTMKTASPAPVCDLAPLRTYILVDGRRKLIKSVMLNTGRGVDTYSEAELEVDCFKENNPRLANIVENELKITYTL